MSRSLKLLHLYPDLMNIYGDHGNIAALQFRAAARDIDFSVDALHVGKSVNFEAYDLIFFGGGQDRSQSLVADDLLKHKSQLAKVVEAGIAGLLICGGYQLFGREFVTTENKKVPGLGIMPLVTKAGSKRLIGNLVCETTLNLEPKTLVGFENHSGQTFLDEIDAIQPLATVSVGNGNNTKDHSEGAIYKSLIGSYMHGSLLPKNSHLADWLLQKALSYRDQNTQLKQLNDEIEWRAHDAAIKRSKQVKSAGIS